MTNEENKKRTTVDQLLVVVTKIRYFEGAIRGSIQ